MPYGIRYHTQFRSRGGNEYIIRIRKKSLDNDFSDELIQLADPGFIIERPAVARYAPIMGSGVTIYIWNTKVQGQLYFKDLFGTGELENKLEILLGTNVIWAGFIVPELYQDAFGSRPRTITVTAMDGLSILKNVNYQPVPGEILTLDAIIEVLKLTGHTNPALQVRVFCNLYPLFLDSSFTDFPSFSFTSINSEGLVKGDGDLIDGYTILAGLLKPFGCFIQQQYDAGTATLMWVIDRWRMLNDSRLAQVYNADGSYDKPFDIVPTIKEVFTDFEVIDGGGLEYESGYRSEELSVDQKKFPNLILPVAATSPTGDSAEFTYPTGENEVNGSQVTPELRRWYVATGHSGGGDFNVDNGTISDDQIFRWHGDTVASPIPSVGFFSVDGLETSTKLTLSDNFAEEVISITVEIDLPQEELQLIIDRPNAADKNVMCVIEVQFTSISSGASARLIQHEPNGFLGYTYDGEWRFVDGDVGVANTFVRLVREHLFDAGDDPNDIDIFRQEFKFDIPGSVWGSAGDIFVEVRLWPFPAGTAFNDDVRIIASGYLQQCWIVKYEVKVTGIPAANITEGVVNTDFVEKYKNSFQFNDVPNFNFSNGFMRPFTFNPIFGGILTETWEEDFAAGGGEFLPLIDRWLRDSMQAFQEARFQLSIEARSEDIRVYDLIDELTVTGKRYIIVGSRFNAKWGVTELSLIEFIKDDGVVIV